MTEEQAFIEWKAEQYKHQSTEEELEFVEHLHYFPRYFKKTFIDGYKECQKEHEWHDLEKDPTDLPKGEEYDLKGIHRKILLQDRYGNIYTGNYYSKDKNHKADCFAVEFLDWGLQGSNFCAKEQISKWKEIE